MKKLYMGLSTVNVTFVWHFPWIFKVEILFCFFAYTSFSLLCSSSQKIKITKATFKKLWKVNLDDITFVTWTDTFTFLSTVQSKINKLNELLFQYNLMLSIFISSCTFKRNPHFLRKYRVEDAKKITYVTWTDRHICF